MRVRFSLLSLLLVACGPAATKTTPVKAPTPPPAAKPVAKVESPARWALHATRLGNLHARLDLGSSILYGGDGGERWLDKRDGSPPTPANTLVPEAIVGIAKAGKGVLLVGASGAVYPAEDPLATPGAKRLPPSPMRSAAAGRAAIVAISDGGLMRTSDGGATWAKVDLPGAAGTLVQVAMNDGGLGLALAAPQRAWATDDDGATWKALPTPGVGARGVVHDVNGDLMLEGVEASGLLRGSPLRLERVARAPKSDGYDLGVAPTAAILSYAKAVVSGRGALVGDRYLEAIPEPDDPTRWRVAFGKLGERIEAKKLIELNGCERVWAAGDSSALFLACDDRGGKTGGALGGKAKTYDRASIRVYRSDDEGKSWKDDGNTGSRRAEVGHVWLAPDHTLIIDGACKRLRNTDCYDSPPLVRPGGQKNFAKLNVKPSRVTQVSSLAFAPQGANAFGLGRSPAGPLVLLASKNGGKDFRALPLPSVAAADANLPALSAARAEPGSISVDASGTIAATASVSGEWLVYTSKDEGQTIEGHRFPHHVDGVSMSGRNGLAWARDGRAWETMDAAVTWTPVAAPSFTDASPSDRAVVCNTHGCLIGDRAVRVGWGGAAIAPKLATDPSSVKVLARAPVACTVEGEWKSLGALLAAPSAYDAEVTAAARWLAIRHDTAKGSVAVVLGKTGPKGIETKEVSLFGPAGKDVATAVLPQIEGAAAIRFAFKREVVPASVASKDDKDKKPKTPSGGIVDNQKVDVEVAWYVASTGVVHRATIKGAGPLDPRDVVGNGKDAAGANVGLLSIAQGGVHVRPFATKPEAPLWFVREGGKVDRLPWPELPTKDVGGSPLPLRVDAVRAANRTVILGVVGSQLITAWANESGSGWESRTWGLWPELKGGPDASWDFSYVAGATGALRPAIVVQWGGGGGVGPTAWAVPLKGVEADPGEAIAMPTQKALGDGETACSATDTAPRVVAPFSIGTRHPVVVGGDVGEQVLATSSAVLRGDGKAACVLAYEAKAIVRGKSDKADKAKPAEEGAYSAVIPWADREHSFLFRSAVNGDTSVRLLKCAAGKENPAGLSTVEGFAER